MKNKNILAITLAVTMGFANGAKFALLLVAGYLDYDVLGE
jgi:hypothetical protein